METLPSGVKIREFYSPQETREEIFRRVKEGYEKRFPIENDKVRIELAGADYDKKRAKISLDDELKAVLTGGRLSVPLRGTVRLIDKATNRPIDEKELTLANVPYMNDDGLFIMGGTQYVTSNQSRLKPGIYARTKDNGELESHFNVAPGTGASMRLSMEPETGVFRASIDKSSIKLYPVLNALGVPDEKLRQVWGDEILKKNQDAYDRNAFGKFYDKLLRQRAVPDATNDVKKSQVLERLAASRFDPEVNSRTLGKPYDSLSTDVLSDASAKLLHISRGEQDEDDRDHPANRTFHSVDDFLADRVRLDAGKLGRTLLYRATYDKSLKHLSPGYFTPQLEKLIVSNQLSQVVPGLNPMEIYDQHNRVIQLGEGGVSSVDSIPVASRNLQAGQLGMIDPIRSSESMSIGVDQRFTIAARKGDDGHVYYPARNLRTGQVEYVNPVMLHKKTMAFPSQGSLKPHMSALMAPVVTSTLPGGAVISGAPPAPTPPPQPPSPAPAVDMLSV